MLTTWISKSGGSPLMAENKQCLATWTFHTSSDKLGCSSQTAGILRSKHAGLAGAEKDAKLRMWFLAVPQEYINHSISVSCSVGQKLYVCKCSLCLLLHFFHGLCPLACCPPGSDAVFSLPKEIFFSISQERQGKICTSLWFPNSAWHVVGVQKYTYWLNQWLVK